MTESPLRLYLVNPTNPLAKATNIKENRWNRYRVWKPLGLLVLAGLTPPTWRITVIDENLGVPDYAVMPRPDLVGVTAFTSQASRAYEVATEFRRRGVPVVMGGIHASMCSSEAIQYADAVVVGEAESIWPRVLGDARKGHLQGIYRGQHADLDGVPAARHDLLREGYAFGAIQTTRGCPLSCTFCSVSAFNGSGYRHRSIGGVINELKSMSEKWILVVDDNLIGTSASHLARAKELFRAMIQANVKKAWFCQATINMADDEELLALAARAGCRGVFIGFESLASAGLAEVGKRFNLLNKRDFADSVRHIQRHRICVAGSFIMGLDTDDPGIGRRIAEAARDYGVDLMTVLLMTPLPGTRLWDQMRGQDRIAAADFPFDWRYYTLEFPTVRFRSFSWSSLIEEINDCDRRFYSLWSILRRFVKNLVRVRRPILFLVGNLSFRTNCRLARAERTRLALLRGDCSRYDSPQDLLYQERAPLDERPCL